MYYKEPFPGYKSVSVLQSQPEERSCSVVWTLLYCQTAEEQPAYDIHFHARYIVCYYEDMV